MYTHAIKIQYNRCTPHEDTTGEDKTYEDTTDENTTDEGTTDAYLQEGSHTCAQNDAHQQQMYKR